MLSANSTIRSALGALIFVCAVNAPSRIDAQQRSQLKVGARIRVYQHKEKPLTAFFSRVDADSISYLDSRKSDTPVSLARTDVYKVQVASRNHPLGALKFSLMGLGIGSSLGSAMSRNLKSPRMALGFCQFLLCAAMTWAAYALTTSLPYWPIDVQLSSDPWIKLQLDMVRAMWAVLPAAILWGASFPLALASVASEGQDPGKLVGGVYAANTVGAIVGSLTASLMLVYFLGTQHSQQVLVGLSALSALLMLVVGI